jgi:hypothetical protein
MHYRILCKNLIVFSYRKILLIVFFGFGGGRGYQRLCSHCHWWTKMTHKKMQKRTVLL